MLVSLCCCCCCCCCLKDSVWEGKTPAWRKGTKWNFRRGKKQKDVIMRNKEDVKRNVCTVEFDCLIFSLDENDDVAAQIHHDLRLIIRFRHRGKRLSESTRRQSTRPEWGGIERGTTDTPLLFLFFLLSFVFVFFAASALSCSCCLHRLRPEFIRWRKPLAPGSSLSTSSCGRVAKSPSEVQLTQFNP